MEPEFTEESHDILKWDYWGRVEVVDRMGTDADIVAAARVSYKNKGSSADEKLINYLMKHDHGSPFEMAVIKFHITCPIFVARQWFRHRIGSFNEISGRYTEMDDGYLMPATLRKQSTSNKQASDDETIWDPELIKTIGETLIHADMTYKMLLRAGVAREQARMVLPLAAYTQFFWCVNARSLMNFMTLRCAEDSQREIQHLATIIREHHFKEWLPLTYNAYMADKV